MPNIALDPLGCIKPLAIRVVERYSRTGSHQQLVVMLVGSLAAFSLRLGSGSPENAA
jgi:hypothetical protein